MRIAPLLLAAAVMACSSARRVAEDDRGRGSVPARSIDEVLAAHTDSLMTLPHVVGTAVGSCDGAPCIKVLVADSSAATRNRIPARLEGFRVVVDVTGPIRPRS